MVVKYNKLNRLEKPRLTLCSPGSVYSNGTLTNVVGILTDHEAEEAVLNFNATSELNFRVNRVRRDDATENAHIYSLYKAIQNRRLVFCDDIGYFMITSIEDGYDGTVSYKDVKAQSIDVEIQQKMIPFIADGTYRFSTSGNEKGILETVVETLPLWTIGHVDGTVASKYRTFEDVDTSTNCLAFFLDNIQDAYECIVIFDIINRTINVYDQANYVHETSVHITKEDVINSIDITENADDLYTALSVKGDDENVTIAAVNPLGTNTIYNFDYYVDWMTSGLKTKVIAWENAVDSAKSNYYQNNLQYYTLLEQASDCQAEISRIETQLSLYKRCRDNIVAEGGTSLVNSYDRAIRNSDGTPIRIQWTAGTAYVAGQIVTYSGVDYKVVDNHTSQEGSDPASGSAHYVYAEIADLLAHIGNLILDLEDDLGDANSNLASINTSLETKRSAISTIRESLSFENYFTTAEYAELCNYIFEGSYTDEYVVITDIMSYEDKFAQMKVLYDRAEKQLERASSPSQEFDVDVENFIFAKDFEHWSEQLETGCLINVELDDGDIALLFLSSMTINYDDHTMSLTFGNRYNKYDTKSLFDDVLGNITKSANTLNYIKDVLYPLKNGEFNAMKEALQTSRDITMGAALTSTGEEVVIDGSGYTGRKLLDNGTYDPHQVKITGKTIVFTDDGWETCKVAIGEILLGDNDSIYGVNAQAIIGDIIVGNNIVIKDNDGNDIFSVMDGKITSRVFGDEQGVLEDGSDSLNKRVSTVEQTADGFEIRIGNLEDNEGKVTSVETTIGYKFDDSGLQISRDGREIENLITEDGMYVRRSGEDILVANNLGVDAINLTARQYLIIGDNSRFENYSNGTDTNRTACFYIGS